MLPTNSTKTLKVPRNTADGVEADKGCCPFIKAWKCRSSNRNNEAKSKETLPDLNLRSVTAVEPTSDANTPEEDFSGIAGLPNQRHQAEKRFKDAAQALENAILENS